MEYLTLDERFTKCCGYHFMLANHFRHNVKINFPYYLKQSLSILVQALQRDPKGEHLCHEGLMVLILNVLKAKSIVRSRGHIKDANYDMEGSAKEKGYDFETQDEDEGGKVNLVKGTGNRSKKKRRVLGHFDLKKESDFVEELVKDYKKKLESKGKRVKDSSGQRDSSPLLMMRPLPVVWRRNVTNSGALKRK